MRPHGCLMGVSVFDGLVKAPALILLLIGSIRRRQLLGRGMTRIRIWAGMSVCLVVLLLTGCAATGQNYLSVSSSIPPLKGEGGRVFFYRTDSMMGVALQPEIRLDHQVVGKSQPGGFFFVDTSAGRHVASSQTESEAKLEFDLEPGGTVYIASSIGLGILVGRIQLELKPETVALSDLSPLRYTGRDMLVAEPSGASPPTGLPSTGSRSTRGRVTMADLELLLPPAAGASR